MLRRLLLIAPAPVPGAYAPQRLRARQSRLLIGALCTLAACGGDSGGTAPPPPPPPAVVVTVTPSSSTVNAGATAQFSATVSNSTNSGITWTASAGTIAPNGASATWTAPGAGGSYTVTAASVADPSKTAAATVTVSSVGIVVSPATGTIGAGDTLPLTASVSNAANEAVTWTASGGSIVGTGSAVQWAAPVAGGSYTVTATSVLDPARSAAASVTVTPVVVSVSAVSDALFRGETTSLTATVTGTSGRSVTWSASCGTIIGVGATVQYTAPTTPGVCELRAVSVRNPASSGAKPLVVRGAWRVAALNDANDGECTYAHCSLREALTAANANADRDSIIMIAPASSGAPAVITLTANLPFISAPVDIVGPGASLLTIDAAATQAAPRGVLYVNGNFTASVRGLTLRGGRRAGGGGLVIDNAANVTLRDVHVRDNRSDGTPGGGVLLLRLGRGMFVDVEITGNRTSGDAAPGGGLAVEAGSMVTMVGGRIADNESGDSFAGGVRVFNSALVLDKTTMANNRANTPTVGLGQGGAIFADGADSRVSLVDAVIENNTTSAAAGGLAITGNAIATISGTVVRGNNSPAGAGMLIGPSTVTVTNSDIQGNTASARGGGVLVVGTARYTQSGGSIRNNVAASQGGGGIYLQETVEATLNGVTIENNRADGSSGGGVWAGNAAALNITGGSVSGNKAGTVGGGLFLSPSAPFSLKDMDIVGNEAATGGGGAFFSAVNGTITNGSVRENRNTAGAGGGESLYRAPRSISLAPRLLKTVPVQTAVHCRRT